MIYALETESNRMMKQSCLETAHNWHYVDLFHLNYIAMTSAKIKDKAGSPDTDEIFDFLHQGKLQPSSLEGNVDCQVISQKVIYFMFSINILKKA